MEEWKGSDWSSYQRLVLAELERHSNALESINKNISKIEVDIALLKLKATGWGLIGGAIPVAIMIIVETIKK